MRILAISGSLKSTSSNSSIVRAIKIFAPAEFEIEIFNSIGDLPHFNPEIDIDPAPEAVNRFRRALQNADAVILCTPEYAFNIPGVLKNALDWTVSSGELVEKPVAAISASPSGAGGDKALKSLLMTLDALSCRIPKEAEFSIPMVLKKLNEKGELTDEETREKLKNALFALRGMI